MYGMTLEEIYRKVREGIRISQEEGLFLLRNSELLDLGDMANEIRFRKNPKQWVTYLHDTNPNYSNVCNVDCIFCAFYRHPGEEGAYRLSSDQLIQKFKEAASKGITTVLLQGGVDPTIPFEYYLELVERTVKEVPEITLKSKNIMGVIVPQIESSKVKKSLVDRGYGVLGTSTVIDETASAFEELVESVIESAEIETTMKRLLDEIEKTKRRVNALEYKVIPELTAARDFIKMRLDEMEREELFRMKRIKARSTS